MVPPILKSHAPSPNICRLSPLRKSIPSPNINISLNAKENIPPTSTDTISVDKATKANSSLTVTNASDTPSLPFLFPPSTHTLTENPILTENFNIDYHRKSLRSTHNRLNTVLNRYKSSIVPKHLTTRSLAPSQSGKKILAQQNPSLTSTMPSSSSLTLPLPPALQRTSRRIKTLRSSTQSLLRGFDPSDRICDIINHTFTNKDIQSIPTSQLRLLALGWNKGQEEHVTVASIRDLNKLELLQFCFNARDNLIDAFKPDSILGCSPVPSPTPPGPNPSHYPRLGCNYD